MAKTIELKATIPLTTPILLSHFYDHMFDQFPLLQRDSVSVKFYFDIHCIACNPEMLDEEKVRIRPMRIDQLKAVVRIMEVSDDFAEFLLLPLEQQIFMQDFCEKYTQYTEQIYDFMFGTLNRVLMFLRTLQGQFWVEELVLDERKDLQSFFPGSAHISELSAEIVDSSIAFSWNPLKKIFGISKSVGPDPRELKPEDWDEIWDFVQSSKRPNLVAELINGAFKLASLGQSRAALTEAVTGLESALFRFSENPKLSLVDNFPLKRLSVSSLKKAVAHLGFTQSIRYLLPLLFNEELLSPELLQSCDKAITLRHDVVHKGQRSVKDIGEHLNAIAQMCQLLLNSTENTDSAN
jgi:hypothetical protein